MDLIVVGSVAYDTLETPAGKREKVLGGSGSYFSVASSFFQPAGLVAVIGDDFNPKFLELLEKFGTDLEGLEKQDGKTFHWTGRYEDHNEAITISTDLNVFAEFSPKLPKKYRSAKTLFLANIDPDLQKDVLSQVDGAALIACDTMNFWINGKRKQLLETLKDVDILLINDQESMMLSGTDNIFSAGEWIMKNGPKTVVIKRGAYGSLLMQGRELFLIPAFPVRQVVDCTGAGDSFAGGFVGFLHATGDHSFENMKNAVAMGTVIASFTVEDFSLDRLAKLTYAEVEKRYNELVNYINLKKLDLGGLLSKK
ncbi:MAG: sugar kinase [Acidobacteria bacterium]|nr:sugar kinase [Acidobacteriota bacterium]